MLVDSFIRTKLTIFGSNRCKIMLGILEKSVFLVLMQLHNRTLTIKTNRMIKNKNRTNTMM